MKNVIMVATDQQQAEAMGCVDPTYKTPNLDKLAEMGVRFSGAISTSAQCTPSRASWMTGRYPHQVGVNQIGHILDPNESCIAKEFNQCGFETAYFGKWHLGNSASDYGFQITDYRLDGFELNGSNSDSRFHSHMDAVSTTQALNYLADYSGDAPFFMTLSWYMPHPNAPTDGPFELIEKYAGEFEMSKMPIPSSYYTDDLRTKPPHHLQRAQMDECKLTEKLIRRDAQRYRTMLALMDWNFGRLLHQLDEKNLLGNTVILFTSDHGDMQGAHRLRLKGVLPYEELYNVPLILYVPGKTPTRRVIPDLVSSSSVPGTLLDSAGLPVPSCFQGGSMLPHLDLHQPPQNERVFFEHYKAYWGHHPFRGVRTAQWKYVYYYEEEREEVYNLSEDPTEICNVADNPGMESIRVDLRSEVDNWWTATGGLSRVPISDETSDWGRNSDTTI